MKKFLLPALFVIVAACSNPEDKATGDPDSTRFNKNDKNNTNAGTEFNNPTSSAAADTSAAPALQKENANSTTSGTNRSYGNARDSGKK